MNAGASASHDTCDALIIGGAGAGGLCAAARLVAAGKEVLVAESLGRLGGRASSESIDAPGLVTFGRTRRLCNLGELTATRAALAPPGWHQCVAYAVPRATT